MPDDQDGTPITWKLVTHWLSSKDQPWIHHHVHSPHHVFDVVTAGYAHDRSKQSTSAQEWLTYFRQALRAWLPTCFARGRYGFISVFPPLAVCLGLIKRLVGSKAPVIAWGFNLSQTFGGAKGRLARFALANVDVFTVFSRREIETYATWLGLPRERFLFIPFTEEMVDPTVAEVTDAPFVLALGTANRDYDTMLQAVGRLGYRTIIVAGAHALAGRTLPPNVELRSGLSLQQCHELCQQARVNVLPLDTEDTASGQVTARYAMMFGKCLVATNSVGTEDYIQDGVTGMLVPPHDAGVLEQAIRDLWEDPGRRAAMGTAARAWLLQEASYDIGPARLLEVIERLRVLGSNPAR